MGHSQAWLLVLPSFGNLHSAFWNLKVHKPLNIAPISIQNSLWGTLQIQIIILYIVFLLGTFGYKADFSKRKVWVWGELQVNRTRVYEKKHKAMHEQRRGGVQVTSVVTSQTDPLDLVCSTQPAVSWPMQVGFAVSPWRCLLLSFVQDLCVKIAKACLLFFWTLCNVKKGYVEQWCPISFSPKLCAVLSLLLNLFSLSLLRDFRLCQRCCSVWGTSGPTA